MNAQPTFSTNPFNSFWMGGFECADHLNSSGDRVDFLTVTDHLNKLGEDYELLKTFNIKTVREGIRWGHLEKVPYEYSFDVVKMMIDTANAKGVQQVWDICHFGFPDDLNPLHPHFTSRFVGVCSAFVKFHKLNYPETVLIVTPVNEVSFLSWLSGEVGGTTPYCIGNGWNVKYAIMRAYIQAIRAMKAIDPAIRILTTEPLVNIVPPLDADEILVAHAAKVNEEQFQALDMLSGAICPELGGSPELLDIIGFNFYYNNQWVVDFESFLPWLNEENDPRWKPFSSILMKAFARYNKPVVLTETSHPGIDRPLWIDFITRETSKVLDQGVPFWGICFYPIIDRPDWDDLTCWHHSGLWDQQISDKNYSLRILHEPYADAIRLAQQAIQQAHIK